MKERLLSEEEQVLWNLVTKNDRLLKGKKRLAEAFINQKNIIKTTIKENKKSVVVKHEMHKEEKLNNTPTLKNSFLVDRRTNQKLKRGLIRPEKTLDLHGLSQIVAQKQFCNFIVTSSIIGLKCVLVITGRKLGLYGPEGILRASVPKWIQTQEVQKHVLSYSYAQQRDGGDGAFYILLRKLASAKQTKF